VRKCRCLCMRSVTTSTRPAGQCGHMYRMNCFYRQAGSVVSVFVCLCVWDNVDICTGRTVSTDRQVAWSLCMCVCVCVWDNVDIRTGRTVSTYRQVAWSLCLCVCVCVWDNVDIRTGRTVSTYRQVAWCVYCVCVRGTMWTYVQDELFLPMRQILECGILLQMRSVACASVCLCVNCFYR